MRSSVKRLAVMCAPVLAVLTMPIQAAVADGGGSGIASTRPVSDASFDVRGPGIATTRPLSDAAFEVRAGVGAGLENANTPVTRRPLSDAGFEPIAVATDAGASRPKVGTPAASAVRVILIWAMVALAILAVAASGIAVGRRRQPMRA